jgi:hypothetical protein
MTWVLMLGEWEGWPAHNLSPPPVLLSLLPARAKNVIAISHRSVGFNKSRSKEKGLSQVRGRENTEAQVA